MKPIVALTTSYAVVDELREELALCHHTIGCLRQALAETVDARVRARRWKQAATYWRKKARRNAVMFRRSER